MSIYRIDRNIQGFMFFTINDLDVVNKMEDFDISGFGQPLNFKWVAPEANFLSDDSEPEVLPDITQWSGSDLIFKNEVRKIFDDLLTSIGDFLPLAGTCEEFWMFNPTQRAGNQIVNLEETKSAYFDDGSWKEIEKLTLTLDAESKVPCLFTADIDEGVNLYCTEAFKAKYENNNLGGLLFEKIDQN